MEIMSNGNHATRREFMRNTGITLAGAAAMLSAGTRAFAAGDVGDKLRIGLVGCGGRGSGAARNALLADPDTVLYALGDAFEDNLKSSLLKFKNCEAADRVIVEPERQFVGFDAYQKVIDCCDVVILATPTFFRPVHLAAAIEKGCHVFCEKPVAVDGPGIRSVLDTCRKAAEKKLNVVSGLCYRYENAKRETIQRIHDGAVGDIVAMECVYNTGGLWHKKRDPRWSEMEYNMRNWIYFYELSGDHIVEQHIHSIDKIAWVMRDQPPAKATASGGRVQRTDPKYGNVYDHFNTVFEWDNGVKCFSSCRQWEGTSTNVSDNIYGTLGRAFVQDHAIETYSGDKWKHERAQDDDMYQNELNELFKAIRAGAPINNGEYMCYSNLMAIMARMSAYSGKTVTWNDAMNSDLVLGPKELAWGDCPANPIAVPGQTIAF